MSSNAYIAVCIAIAAVVTLILRAVPFVLFSGKNKTPKVMLYLGRVLPYAVMAMLVVYCLKGVSISSISGWLPELIASAVVAGSYVLKRNSLLSIILGTVCYMLLVQLVF